MKYLTQGWIFKDQGSRGGSILYVNTDGKSCQQMIELHAKAWGIDEETAREEMLEPSEINIWFLGNTTPTLFEGESAIDLLREFKAYVAAETPGETVVPVPMFTMVLAKDWNTEETIDLKITTSAVCRNQKLREINLAGDDWGMLVLDARA